MDSPAVKGLADHLKKKDSVKGMAGYRNRIVNRILACLKTLPKWIYKLTGIIVTVQGQLGHANSAYSIQSARAADQEKVEA